MMTIGIDEVGRGCWAGPLVAAAVCFDRPGGPGRRLRRQLADSKQLTPRRREELFRLIAARTRIGLGWVSPAAIDRFGLTRAQTLAMDRALAGLGHRPKNCRIIIDGPINYLAHRPASRPLARADQTVPAVMAASIAAKVLRDRFCRRLAGLYPGWGLESHKGYGTAGHRRQLAGRPPVTGLHRFSYRPVAAAAYQT